MAKKAEGSMSQQDKIRAMIKEIGWNASPDECVKFLKDKFDLVLDKAYVSQLRSAERKRQNMPPLRIRKGSKAAKVRKAAAASSDAPAAVAEVAGDNASAVDITKFVIEMTKWQEKLGEKTIKAVLQTLSK